MYRLLLVEDEEILLNWMKCDMDWASLGYEVACTASNGMEALNRIENTHIDAVLTDIHMPDMDGIELMKMLHTNHPGIKVVVLSGYNTFEHARKAMQFGAYDFLSKPLDVGELERVFAEIGSIIKQERQEIRNSAIHTKSIFLDHERLYRSFLEGLLTKPPERSFIAGSLEQLGVVLHEEFLCVAAVRVSCDQPSGLQQIKPEFVNLSAEVLGTEGYGFVWIDNIFFVIMGRQVSSPLYDIKKEMSLYKAAMEEKLEPFFVSAPRITLGLSSAFSGYEKLRGARNQAVEALSFSFYEGVGRIIDFSQVRTFQTSLPQDRGPRDAAIDDKAERLIDAVVGMEGKSIRLSIENYFDAVSALKITDISFIRLKVLQFFMTLEVRYREKKIAMQTLREKEQIYTQIFAYETLHDLKLWFVKKIEGILGEFSDFVKINQDKDISAKVKDYINFNIDRKIMVADLAEAIHMNQTYLCTIFKKETGITLVNYITEAKVQKAKEYLEEPGIRIKDISDMVGFSDYRYFCTIFKKETGITPLEYRSQKLLRR